MSMDGHSWSNQDHKPLESISRKSLADTPAWQQCMMLHLQGYDLTICYCPGKEMVIPDTISWFSPQSGPELPLNITIHHARIMPDSKEAFQQAFVNDPEMQALADLIITGWPEDIKEVPHPLCPYWQHRETLTIEDGLVLWGEALLIPPAKRERTLNQQHQFHQGITKSQLLMCGSFFWPGINKAIEEVVHQCEACTWFQSQNAAAPLTPTPTPLHPWQMCATDIFTLEGIDHLVVGNFYSKMILVWRLPPGQNNTNKVVLLLKKMFSEHGIPEALCSENGPQYASAQFANFCMSWGITHETSSPHYPQSNGFAEACVKSIKHALQWAKLQQCQSTSCLTSTLSYTHRHQTSISSRAVVPMLTQNNLSSQDMQQWPISHTHPWADWHTLWICQGTGWQILQILVPLYAGQPVAKYDTLQGFGFPLLWYVSSHGTAIKYAPAMVPHTATCRGTSVNAASRQSTLSPVAQLPHCRLWQDPTFSGTTCITHLHHACSPLLLHLQHWQPRWNRLQLFLPCQLFRRMPQHQSLWHPMPHLCSHKDLAVPTWHQDVWSRRSENYRPRLSMDLVIIMHHCIHPSNFSAMYHNLRKGDVIWSYCLVLRAAPLVSWPPLAI